VGGFWIVRPAFGNPKSATHNPKCVKRALQPHHRSVARVDGRREMGLGDCWQVRMFSVPVWPDHLSCLAEWGAGTESDGATPTVSAASGVRRVSPTCPRCVSSIAGPVVHGGAAWGRRFRRHARTVHEKPRLPSLAVVGMGRGFLCCSGWANQIRDRREANLRPSHSV